MRAESERKRRRSRSSARVARGRPAVAAAARRSVHARGAPRVARRPRARGLPAGSQTVASAGTGAPPSARPPSDEDTAKHRVVPGKIMQ